VVEALYVPTMEASRVIWKDPKEGPVQPNMYKAEPGELVRRTGLGKCWPNAVVPACGIGSVLYCMWKGFEAHAPVKENPALAPAEEV
jgi:hypothetical protein